MLNQLAYTQKVKVSDTFEIAYTLCTRKIFSHFNYSADEKKIEQGKYQNVLNRGIATDKHTSSKKRLNNALLSST